MTQSLVISSPYRWVLVFALLLAGQYFFFPVPEVVGFFLPDSEEYLTVAKAIYTGDFFTFHPSPELGRGIWVRTPGYPLILALAHYFVKPWESTVMFVHITIAVFAMFFLCIALRQYLHPFLTALCLLLAPFALRFFSYLYFRTLMTEWTVVFLLLLFFGSLTRYFRFHSGTSLLVSGILFSFIILTKPALIVGIPLFLGLLLGPVQKIPLKSSILLASFFPIFLWMSFNFARFGVFSITPFSGTTLFGLVSSTYSEIDIAKAENKSLSYLKTEMMKRRELLSRSALSRLPFSGISLEDGQIIAANSYKGVDIGNEQNWTQVTLNRLMLEYALSAIRENPAQYFRYVLVNLDKFLYSLILLLLNILFLAMTNATKSIMPIAFATLFLGVLHSCHMLLVGAIEVALNRYYFATFVPAFTTLCILMCSYIYQQITLRREQSEIRLSTK